MKECGLTDTSHTFVLLRSSYTKQLSLPDQVTHPTSYCPSPVPGSRTADHTRPSFQQSAWSLRYRPDHGLYHRKIGLYWSILFDSVFGAGAEVWGYQDQIWPRCGTERLPSPSVAGILFACT